MSPDDEVEVSSVFAFWCCFPIFASLTKIVQQLQVKEVKLSPHINMALAYIKLEKVDNAFQSCNEALAIDPKNVKALYRRATVQHNRRKFDEALNDLKQAEELAPDDKAVKKLKRLVDHEILKQKKKEQAMAKKLFGLWETSISIKILLGTE